MFKQKKIFKILVFGVLGVVVLYVLLFAVYFFGYRYYASWKIGRDYQKFEQGILDYFRSDTYGGKTPQETYQMFISALQKGDLDSASQYFYWEKQAEEKERLEKLKAEGKLEEYIESLPKWEDLTEEEYWDKDGRRYSYKYIQKEDEVFYDPLLKKERIISAGEYQSWIDFQLNKQAQIWKIYSL
jgi:hypothetical protein